MGRRKSKSSGNQLLLLLVLLGILGGAGAWNYQRNLAAEGKEARPYRTLSDADLETLIDAYTGEVERLTGRETSARRAPAAAGAAGGDRWSEFEQVQRHSRAVREIHHQRSEHEAALEELRREQQRRAKEGDEVRRFLRRLLSFRA